MWSLKKYRFGTKINQNISKALKKGDKAIVMILLKKEFLTLKYYKQLSGRHSNVQENFPPKKKKKEKKIAF